MHKHNQITHSNLNIWT